jgi:hypothetical protein
MPKQQWSIKPRLATEKARQIDFGSWVIMDEMPIQNEQEYGRAIDEVTRYFDDQPAFGTPASERFKILTALIR